ncbi:hypothetical protein LTR85_002820 [Meristemomyces frigidus]|nr:hypothetical protein LTR85_002820 [Meristemomyces frigidus]
MAEKSDMIYAESNEQSHRATVSARDEALELGAPMEHVYVVVAAGSVIAFIIRDMGDASIAGWIIQGPLLMQSVLSPVVGRLSDVLDRKYLAAVPPLIAFVGAVISAKAK